MGAAICKRCKLRGLAHNGAEGRADVIGDVIERPPVDYVVKRRTLAVGAMLNRTGTDASARQRRHGHSVKALLPAYLLFNVGHIGPRDRRRHRQIALHRFKAEPLVARDHDPPRRVPSRKHRCEIVDVTGSLAKIVALLDMTDRIRKKLGQRDGISRGPCDQRVGL